MYKKSASHHSLPAQLELAKHDRNIAWGYYKLIFKEVL